MYVSLGLFIASCSSNETDGTLEVDSTRFKKIDTIDFEIEGRDPMNCRKSPKFSKYFDSLWKELDVDAKEK